jgi:YHS domain-containing protein
MRLTLLLAFSLLLQQAAGAQTASKHLNLEKGIALQGYDAVAYHTQKKAIRGKQSYSLAYAGALWYFATAANRQLFQQSPGIYEPAYGGWCAFAMGETGKKVEVDPETFKLIDGKLFLFYNKYLTNTLNSWNKNEAALRKQADLNWARLIR